MSKSVARNLAVFCVALMCAGAVQAGEVDEADAALKRKEYATALRIYRAAANKGSAHAQYRIGIFYELGTEVKKDYDEAERWFKLASEQQLC